MMKIYTRTGDKGKTSLFGGDRIVKSHCRLHAYGTLDELNAVLGIILTDKSLGATTKKQLHTIQNLLFDIGADLATPLRKKSPIKRMNKDAVVTIEQWIDIMEEALEPLTQFILPGGSQTSAFIHLARTVCRRAERWTVELSQNEPITRDVLVILNRLSDYFFVLARTHNKKEGVKENTVTIEKAI